MVTGIGLVPGRGHMERSVCSHILGMNLSKNELNFKKGSAEFNWYLLEILLPIKDYINRKPHSAKPMTHSWLVSFTNATLCPAAVIPSLRCTSWECWLSAEVGAIKEPHPQSVHSDLFSSLGTGSFRNGHFQTLLRTKSLRKWTLKNPLRCF